MNYYERHIGDYLKDTAHLSLLEHGIYTRLLDVYYTRETGIPEDQVARLIGARTKDEREALDAVLHEFFVLGDKAWTQDRCEREIARYQDKQAKAKRSADARWSGQRAQSEGNANASETHDASGMRTHCEGNALQSPVTSNQTPELIPDADASLPTAAPPCPHQRLLRLFAEKLPELPKPRRELWEGSKGAEAMRQRWLWLLAETRESGERYATTLNEGLEWFGTFFDKVAESDFLTGRNGKWGNCDLTWLMTRENFRKVVDGNYEKKGVYA